MDSHSFQLLKPICRFFFPIPISLTFVLIPLLVPLCLSLSLSPSPSPSPSPSSLPLSLSLSLSFVCVCVPVWVCTFLLTLHMKSMFCVCYQFLPHTSCLCIWHHFRQAASPGSGRDQVNTLVGVQTNFPALHHTSFQHIKRYFTMWTVYKVKMVSSGVTVKPFFHRQHCSPRLGGNCTKNGWRCLHSLWRNSSPRTEYLHMSSMRELLSLHIL